MINDIKKWKEVTKGIYRYVIAPGAAYEIHVLYYEYRTGLLNAPAKLFIVGEWYEQGAFSFFEREELTGSAVNITVRECLERAKKDDEENNRWADKS